MRSLALVLLLAATPLRAEDWTGKFIMLKTDDVMLQRKSADGTTDEKEWLEANTIYQVRRDDGNVLEIVGRKGSILRFTALPLAEAAPFWSEQIRQNPTTAKFYARRAKAVLNLERNYIARDRDAPVRIDFVAVLADLNEAIRLEPNGPYWWNDRARVHHLRGEHQKAIDDYTELIRLASHWAGGYTNRGTVYSEMKDYDKALADYNRALELEPKAPTTLTNRGNIWLRKKDFDKAIADYTRAIEIDIRYLHAWQCRGQAYAEQKDFDQAIANFTEALAINPREVRSLHYRGMSYALRGDSGKAHDDFLQAVKLDPKNDAPLATLALFFAANPDERVRDGCKALHYACQALALNDSARTREALAAAYAQNCDFENAVKEQTLAIKKYKDENKLEDDELKKQVSRRKLYEDRKPFRAGKD